MPLVWEASLQWLHHLQPSPPPHRTSLWRKLNYETKKLYFTSLHHLHTLVIQSTAKYDDVAPAYQSSSLPFWHLAVIFDTLILHPKQGRTRRNPNDLVKARLRQYKQGHLQPLHEAAHSRRPSSAQSRSQTAAEAAQMAADEDNYHTAYARLTATMPVASITPAVKLLCQKLYPPPTPYQGEHRPPRRRKCDTYLEIDNEVLLASIRKLKRGTAAGPFGDLTDTLRACATFQTPETEDYPCLDTFSHFLELILNNQVHPTATDLLASNHFMALHKEPKDPTKLRPIGMGSAYRRILGKYIMEAFGTQFATFLLPVGQFGVALKGGLDLILHMTRTNIHRYMSDPNLASRVLLLLDIRNMFNSCSRAAVRDLLATTEAFQSLLPFFDFLYGTDNKCYYFNSDGDTDYFLQKEGFAQGCPLGPILASLCFYLLLRPLQKELADRASARRIAGVLGDDGLGSLPSTSSYLDDTTAWLIPEDIAYFLDRFTAMGAPLGIVLNPAKTKILTNTAGTPILTSSHPKRGTIAKALTTLFLLSEPRATNQTPHLHQLASHHHEFVNGCRLLGQPIGSTAFANKCLLKAATAYETNLHRLQHDIQDKHTAFALYTSCALPSLQHLLAADVAHNATTLSPPDCNTWDSPFLSRINAINDAFFLHLTDTQSLHPTAKSLLHTPTADGGVGVRDMALSAIPSCIISHTRSLRHATSGIPVGDAPIKLPPPHARCLASWEHSSNPTFHTHRQMLNLLLPTYATLKKLPEPPTPSHFVAKASLDPLSKQLYSHAAERRLTTVKDNAPKDIKAAFPSILSPLTSLPFASYDRRHKPNRLKPTAFTVLLQRKMRLPILPPEPHHVSCRHCHRCLDKYGDHFFRCRYNKKQLHNHVRDALYVICRSLAEAGGFAHSKHGVTRETSNLLPDHPSMRPADVGILLKQSSLAKPPQSPIKYLAIDVTIPSSPKIYDDQPASLPKSLAKAHLNSIKRKLKGTDRQRDDLTKEAYLTEIIQNQIMILPFTLDHLGGLGPFAHNLLFGKPSDGPLPFQPPPLYANRFSPKAKNLAQMLNLSPSALLPKASRKFGQLDYAGIEPAALPAQPVSTATQWALKTLALNTSLALSIHLHKSISNAYRGLHDDLPDDLACHFTPYRSLPIEIHDPLPHFLLPTANSL